MATDMSYLSLETLTTFDLGGLTVSAGHPSLVLVLPQLIFKFQRGTMIHLREFRYLVKQL